MATKQAQSESRQDFRVADLFTLTNLPPKDGSQGSEVCIRKGIVKQLAVAIIS